MPRNKMVVGFSSQLRQARRRPDRRRQDHAVAHAHVVAASVRLMAALLAALGGAAAAWPRAAHP